MHIQGIASPARFATSRASPTAAGQDTTEMETMKKQIDELRRDILTLRSGTSPMQQTAAHSALLHSAGRVGGAYPLDLCSSDDVVITAAASSLPPH
eukprot:9451603-Heterocapsa_arctica.AAC.1